MNGWDRVPRTVRCRVRVEDYLNGLCAGSWSFVTVLRLARQMEVFGVPREGVYHELRRLGWSDVNNLVLAEMSRREREAAATKPVFALRADGSLAPTGRLREMPSFMPRSRRTGGR